MAHNEIPDDIKQMLRSVLISSPGVKQDDLCKEYKDAVGEVLKYMNYGFRNLYEFLSAMNGEVTRLEFCERLEDNVVYAVLDKNSYTSKHATKNAVKYGTGVPSKSPSEIKEWKMRKHGQNNPLATATKHKKKDLAKILSSLKAGQNAPIQKQVKERIESVPTETDWASLKRIRRNAYGFFTLEVRNIGGMKQMTIREKDLLESFKKYTPLSVRYYRNINYCNRQCAMISFEYLINTYYAWRDKDQTVIDGQRISAKPFYIRGEYQSLENDHELIVTSLPKNLLMTTLVEAFSKYQGLTYIEGRTQFNSASVHYSHLISAGKAKDEISSLLIDGVSYPVKINFVTKSSCGNGKGIIGDRPSLPQHLQNSNNLITIPRGMPPTNQKVDDSMISTTKRHQEIGVSQPVINPKATMMNAMQQPQSLQKIENSDNEFDHLHCGFSLTYSLACGLFHECCKRTPRTAQNLADTTNALVTHPVDSCRFWVITINAKNDYFSKLTEIEKRLIEDCAKVAIPNVLPKAGSRGAAKFNGVWYRCWVVNACIEKDQIDVFFCDYGNLETITKEEFRSTYVEIWKIPPIAVPCKFYNYENKYKVGSEEYERGSQRLIELIADKPLQVEIVKSASYSQPHIVEVKSVYDINKPGTYIEDILRDEGYIKEIGNTDDNAIENNEISNEIHDVMTNDVTSINEGELDSFYDYDEEDLIQGMLSQVQSANLFYLHLGSSEGFASLENLLRAYKISGPPEYNKGSLALFISENERKRVLIIKEEVNMVEVLYTDHGGFKLVPKNYLYSMSQELKDYPFLARPGTLAGISFPERRMKVKATQFLKAKVKQPLKFNIVKEDELGQVYVEIFEVDKKRSLNKQLIDVQYGMYNDKIDLDLESIISNESEPVRLSALTLENKEIVPKPLMSLKINNNGKPFIPLQAERKIISSRKSTNDEYVNEPVEQLSPENKKKNVASWLKNTPEGVDKSFAGLSLSDNSDRPLSPTFPPSDNFMSDSDDRPISPSFPPPDIVASNLIHIENEESVFKMELQSERKKLEDINQFLIFLSNSDYDDMVDELSDKCKKLDIQKRLKKMEKLKLEMQQNCEALIAELGTTLKML